jgi:hypothetical protein
MRLVFLIYNIPIGYYFADNGEKKLEKEIMDMLREVTE